MGDTRVSGLRMNESRGSLSKLLVLAGAIALGIGALVLVLLMSSREATWQRTTTSNENLLYTVGHVVERTLDSGDRGIRHAISVIERGGGLEPDKLFAGMPENGYGIQLVLDAEGHIMAASSVPPQGDWNFADRPYFTVHRDNPDVGLFMGSPFISAFDGIPSVPLSRRWNRPDGSFGGVVVQTLKLTMLAKLFSSFELGPESGINLFLNDGSILIRFPYTGVYVGRSLAGTANFERFAREKQGHFVGVAAIDNIERLYVFRTLERYPLILNVAQSTETILGSWQRNAIWLGALTLLLMAACVGLAVLAERSLRAHRSTTHRLAQAERELRTIIDSLPVLVAYWDKDLISRMANSAHERWMGRSPDQLRGRRLDELIDEETCRALKPQLDAVLAGKHRIFERSLLDSQGKVRHTVCTLIPDLEDEAVKGFFSVVTDITEIKESQLALSQQQERFRIILESIKDGVITTDREGRVLYLNPAAEAILGWNLESARGKQAEEVMQVEAPEGTDIIACPLHEVLTQHKASRSKVELILKGPRGVRMHIEYSAAPLLDESGHLLGAVVVFHDSGPVRAIANKMSHLAQHDALTGLPNRRRLDAVGEQALSQARNGSAQMAVLYLDLDGFKQVNDKHGHAVGDQLLVAVTRRMGASLRATDTLFRQGGDEFVVLMTDVATKDDAQALAERLIEVCRSPVEVAGYVFNATVSIGISLFPGDAVDFQSLVHYADEAMYRAKMSGRNGYAWHCQRPDLVLIRSDAEP